MLVAVRLVLVLAELQAQQQAVEVLAVSVLVLMEETQQQILAVVVEVQELMVLMVVMVVQVSLLFLYLQPITQAHTLQHLGMQAHLQSQHQAQIQLLNLQHQGVTQHESLCKSKRWNCCFSYCC
jgi:hypothetical protein